MEERFIHVYVEKIDPVERFILLDFVKKDEFQSFMFSNQLDYAIQDREDYASEILLQHANFTTLKGHYPREGHVYKVPVDRLREQAHWEYNYMAERNRYFSVAFLTDASRLDLSEVFRVEVSQSQFTMKVQGNWDKEPCGAKCLTDDIKIVIKNVGQGNRNEIWDSSECHIIFDYGCSTHWSEKRVKKFIADNPIPNGKPSLIISHWDIDHYNMLKCISDMDLKKLCCVYVPANCTSLTSKNIAKKLQSNCAICAVEEFDQRAVARRVSLCAVFHGEHYILFGGERSKNKNLSGLALAIWNDSGRIFLCADHSYAQVFQDMEKTFHANAKMKQRTFHLVVPHHGGEGGKIPQVKFSDIPGDAIVSTGPNCYGHPNSDVRKSISSIGFQWRRTDVEDGDIEFSL